jgi:RimJ/RimL family protein N-acetyltransferase
MRQLAKKLAKLLLGDYAVYYIYACTPGQGEKFASIASGMRFAPVDKAQVEASKDPLIADHAGYHGSETHGYACFRGAEIVGLCYFWHGARYRERNFWPLEDDEAKLVQISVVPKVRGRAVATNLIACASEDMFQKGFRCLYARIWHSNTPSRRAFQRAGWIRVATVIQVRPVPWIPPLRVVIRALRRIPPVEPAAVPATLRDVT